MGSNGNGNGKVRRAYARSEQKDPTPKWFVVPQRIEQRTFTDSDGTIYEIIWPMGNMSIREILQRGEDAEAEFAW